MPTTSSNLTPYLDALRAADPTLTIATADLVTDGQYNAVLVINGDLIARFPRFPEGARKLHAEVALLAAIGPYLTPPIPRIIHATIGESATGATFAAYPRLPGEPLRREALAGLDYPTTRRVAAQLAGFLRELHGIPPRDLCVPPPPLAASLVGADWRAGWRDLYARIRAQVFPRIGSAARAGLAAHFGPYLDDDANFAFVPALIHGDFGPGNVLFEREVGAISGVIDFGSAGLGDPACDLAAILTWGDAFAQLVLTDYPALLPALPRARFYRGTFAAQEALCGAEHGDSAALARGIAPYLPASSPVNA